MKRFFVVILSCLSCIYGSADDVRKSEVDARKFDYFFLEALRLKEKEEPTNAYNAFQYALQLDSTSSAALFELSQYYLFLDKDSLAFNALQKAVKYQPEQYKYKIALADLSREMRRFDEAIAIYEELAKEYPAKAEIHFYLSNLYLQTKQIDKAIQSLENLENNVGTSEIVSMQKYQLFSYIGKDEEAVKEIEKLSAKYPMEAKYPIMLGDMCLEKNDAANALKYYDRAYRLDANNPYYFLSMARYYEHQGDADAVIREIDKALRNPQLEIETKLEILGKYIQNLRQTQKDLESANALLETLLEQHSQEKELNLMYGKFLLLQNKVEEAKFQFQIVTEAEPDIPVAWRELLNIAMMESNWNEAIRLCDNALIYFSDSPEFYYFKGIVCSLIKKYALALEVFQKGLEKVTEDKRPILSNFHAQIGDMYYQLSNKEKAYQSYDKSLEYDEANFMVLNNYAYFLSLDKKDLNKAERMSAKCVQAQPNNATFIDTYAWVFFQKGNYSLAKFYIESALSKNKEPNGDITEHYGDILFMAGEIDRAVGEWEKALDLKEKEESNTETIKKKINDKKYYEEK